MMIVYKWLETYEIGNRVLDTQNRELFSLINEFHTTSKEVLNGLLDQLSVYLRAHFKKEEKLLASLHYPDLYWHHRKHAEIIQQVNELCLYTIHCEMKPLNAEEKITDLLVTHILNEDTKYKRFLSAPGEEHPQGAFESPINDGIKN